MTWWHAVILGLVEGITEYLPVSSTGHLIITSALLGLDDPAVKQSVDTFTIVVQGGAILAVLGLYRERVLQMIRGVLGKDPAGRKLAINIVIAFLPAAVLGVMFDDWIEARLFSPIPVLAALALGGLWMIWLDRPSARRASAELHEAIEHDHDPEDEKAKKLGAAPRRHLDIGDITWRTALAIGFFQVVAMWPGTSRSMMTIAGGTLLGLHPKKAAEFSFLLGLPTLGGATVYKLAKNLKESHDAGTPNMFEQLGVLPVAIGLIVATISAAIAVKWLVSFLNKHGLAVFGWYRLALCAALGALIAAKIVQFG